MAENLAGFTDFWAALHRRKEKLDLALSRGYSEGKNPVIFFFFRLGKASPKDSRLSRHLNQ